MKEEYRKNILDNEKEQIELQDMKKQIRKEIDELVEELLNSSIVRELKEKGQEYKEAEQTIENLMNQNKKLRSDSAFLCRHPLVCLTGYKKHNDSNRVIPSTREEAEYASVKCLECGKNLYTIDKKTNPDNFESMVFIHHYVRSQNEPEFQLRPCIKLPSGVRVLQVYDEYQSLMLNEDEKQVVQKILKKYKN
jgi:hypothetical protein